ncbi:MAG: NAD-binding protein, partial [Halanaerobiales bacterium]
MLFSLEKIRVVILGLNYISLYLAKKMSRTNNVVIIYEKTSCEKRFIEELDVIIEKVDRNILTVLQKYTEGVNSIVFISMTNCEELNLLSALKMKKLGAHKTAALIYNNDFYNFDYQIDYILNPLQLVLENIHIKLKFTRLHRVRNIVPGKLNLAVLRLTEGDKYLHLKLAKRKSNNSLIVAVKRNSKYIIPESEIRAEPGDLLYVIYKPGNSNWHRFISNGRMSSRKVFILGGNSTGIYLAYHWQDLFRKIIILEKDYSRCEYLASRLQKPLILHGRVTEINLLQEEGIDQNSTLVAVNDDDLASLVGSFSALRSHCRQVITVLKSQQSKKTAELMDLKNILTVPELV